MEIPWDALRNMRMSSMSFVWCVSNLRSKDFGKTVLSPVEFKTYGATVAEVAESCQGLEESV